jgi:tether containing UBX domain for GLUT4
VAHGGTTSGSGQLYYETPVLNIMGRELGSFEDFQKTLSQMGYNSGSVLIRLSYKLTDQTLYEAMEQIGQFFKDEGQTLETSTQQQESNADPSAAAHSEDTPMEDSQSASLPSNEQQLPPPSSEEPLASNVQVADVTPETPASEPNNGDPFRPVNVFLAPSGTTPAAALAPVRETDFTPTAAHAQLHQARLQENSRNKRLLSDKELEEKAAAEDARIAAVKSVLVRVRFPDNTSSEWQVGPAETGAFLYEAVRHIMASKGEPFHLVLPGGKEIIKDDSDPRHSLIKGYKLSGRVLVNLVWEDSVKPEVRRKPFLQSRNRARLSRCLKCPKQQRKRRHPSRLQLSQRRKVRVVVMARGRRFRSG